MLGGVVVSMCLLNVKVDRRGLCRVKEGVEFLVLVCAF